ncbi:MAG: PilZ domain-containing protein [Candidatus Eisenbacteria bacterium]|nr:PilZ domain-containing protein [Candidatus Eisenbacteria bacterium]
MKKTTRRRERRVSLRVDARLSMRVEGAPDGGPSAQIVTESQNISASGVYCLSSHFLPPLSKVQLTIVLPKLPGRGHAQELVKCEGIVVRCELLPQRKSDPRYQLACMFSGLERAKSELLEEFVTWRNLQALRAALAPSPAGKKAPARKRTARAGSSRTAGSRVAAPRRTRGAQRGTR